MTERKTLKKDENGILEIGGIKVTDLAAQYKTPLYVYDRAHIEDVCKSFSETVEKYYGLGKVFYASKAFSCKEIYRITGGLRLGADVVSVGEMRTALSVGFPAENLCFHGNNKSYVDLEFAVNSGVGYIVIDALSEIDDIDVICKNAGKCQKILLRVNPGIEAHTHHYVQTARPDSKFGFNIATGDAEKAIEKLLTKKNLNFCGLHCHIGSQIFEKKSFVIAADRMTDLYKRVNDKYGVSFDVLNLGGGFGIRYTEQDPAFSLSDYTDYVRTICVELEKNVTEKGIKKPYLMLEPGRSIVGEAGVTLYTVGRIKEISGIKNYLSVDGGMFDNPRFALYQAKYEVLAATRLNEKPVKTYTVAGKCCESGDLIAEDVSLPEMREGEILAVLSTGAYNYSMASNYNRNFVPPVVMVKDGRSYCCVKPQSFEDLVRNDL